ncbi:HAMP domain-containing sensor histidine kinase [Exiguobacterium profundum]|uniref:HAMP domain-containing sensor histidine kinase n=1 Tax=Exiguobacterium TaxID=33986 RepID=UPI0012F3C9C7|nr:MULTISPECIES: HAMP domain-containing sensor histidine kinase [Exiguobacterium]MDX5981260.1 HAMP domain-containing sensor histidine kinase [Exiguobacterium profundum]VXC01602.1 Histidine kinase [Exiguobacterium sp. 8H]VXC22154.1 Histidine kinase [Exiguobacterium sp. 8A]
MRRRQWDRLLVKLIGIILVNALIATIAFLIMGYSISLYYIENETTPDPLTSNLMFLGVTFIVILIFIIGFSLMMRKTLRKITYLSSEIEQIANGDLGRTVKVEGRDEIASLGESVNRMSAQLSELFEKERAHEEERNQLFSNLSHDLRTPLTSIKGYTQLLQMNRELTLAEKDHFRILNEKTDQLEHLLDQLMNVNRLYAPHMQLKKQRLNLSLLTTQLIHEMEPLFNERGHRLHLSIQPDRWIVADQEQLIRVFENLFSNAWKYAEQTSPIQIDLQTREDMLEWSISNATTTETIDAIPYLFDRTYRVDSSRGVTPGDGLGLSIARQIILLHGGRLTAAPLEGQVICFRVSLPVE